jgi:hypothetical protein
VPDGLLLDFPSPCGAFKLTFEDDGRVAYAYLKQCGGGIVGDVWLYNRCAAPAEPEWLNKNLIPFANSATFVGEAAHATRGLEHGEVIVTWQYEAEQPIAYVYVQEELCGALGVGDKPGYARHAVKDGPLAKVMRVTNENGTEPEVP